MIAYLDMPSGISGDMFLGCLVDAGWPLDALLEVVEKLGLPADSWRVEAQEVLRGPIRATLVDVHATEATVHRHLSDILSIIQAADLPDRVQTEAMAVFRRLAQAEARVHGMTVDQVHFHEVGAVDAIIDIVGTCAGLEALGIDRLHAGSLPLGPGWARADHGQIPLPAPATLTLLAAASAPTRPAPGPGELVTPTGAALLCELALFSQPPMTLERIATGAGQKSFEWPNVARLWLGEPAPSPHPTPLEPLTNEQTLVQLETNIDDMNPELYGFVADKLFAGGALDVWTASIQMKKQRPGTLLSVLAHAANEEKLAQILLRQTTTLGVRVHRLHRHEAEREVRLIETELGSAHVKVKFMDGEAIGITPEHDDCRALAEAHGLPLYRVYEVVREAAQQINFHHFPTTSGEHHD